MWKYGPMTHSTYPRIMRPDGHYWQHVRVLTHDGVDLGVGIYSSRLATVAIGRIFTTAWQNTANPDVVRLTK